MNEAVTAEQERLQDDDIARAEELKRGYDRVRAEVAKVIHGQEDVVELVLLTVLVGGNSLIVGVPGLAKTLLIHTLAQVLDLSFSRIQFTPDLMPSDITGTDLVQEDPETGRRELVFLPGPVFANIVLADEINRTPPKTQSALLEAMQEHRVTIQGKTYELEEPFFVFATQNPISRAPIRFPRPSSIVSCSKSSWAICRKQTSSTSSARRPRLSITDSGTR